MDIRRSKNIMGTREEGECSRRTVAEEEVPHKGHQLVVGEAGMISEWVVKVEDMAHPGGSGRGGRPNPQDHMHSSDPGWEYDCACFVYLLIV